ncbi:MAG: hypothetical protein AB7F59_06380 [Bdellovibrionales bacterium]
MLAKLILLLSISLSTNVYAAKAKSCRFMGQLEFPLEIKQPADLLNRTTRLQDLLQKTSYAELKDSKKNSEVEALIHKDSKWLEEPGYAAAAMEYFVFFSMEDIFLMAANEKYAKKVAGDLRSYANVNMGGRTSIFRNDDVYYTARLFADRWRLVKEGSVDFSDEKALDTEARKSGVKPVNKKLVYYSSPTTPDRIAQQEEVSPAGTRVDSVLAGLGMRFEARSKNESQGLYLGLEDSETSLIDFQPILLKPQEAQKILIEYAAQLKNDKSQSLLNYGANNPSDLTSFSASEVAQVIFGKIRMSYQYLVQDIRVLKIPAAASARTFPNYVPSIPVKHITSFRRVYAIEYDMPESWVENDRFRRNSFNFYFYEPWQNMP